MRAQCYLSFDYGLRRIGVAVGDDLTGSARALTTLDAEDWPQLMRTIDDWRPSALIVGIPLDESGGEQAMSVAARRFAAQLAERSGLPVHPCDERYSSRAADDVLRDARHSGRMTRRVRKGDRDSEAARVILAQWLQHGG